jgi:hypothetical protein
LWANNYEFSKKEIDAHIEKTSSRILTINMIRGKSGPLIESKHFDSPFDFAFLFKNNNIT